jgi:hypothetical protein
MARTALRLGHKTSAWASWLPHWPTCHATCLSEISRGDSIGLLIQFDSWFHVFFVFLPTAQKFEAGRWLFLIGSVVPGGRLINSHQIPEIIFSPAAISAEFHLQRAAFVVNSPHTGACPSVHLCV